MAARTDKNQFLGIAGSLGGAMVAITALVVIFASANAWVLAPIALCLTLLGIGLGHQARK